MADQNNEDFFEGASFGFSAIDRALARPDPRQTEEQQIEQYEHAKKYLECFSTPAGRYVLNDMMQTALMGPRFDAVPFTIQGRDGARPVDGMTMAFQGFYREGSASWYYMISRLMERAQEGPPGVRNSEPARRRKRNG